MAVKEISPFDFNESPFRVIGKDWLLVTGEYEGKSNGMTASWGGLGIMWGKPVAYIFIRATRRNSSTRQTACLCRYSRRSTAR